MVFVVNCGSSSIKYKLFNASEAFRVLVKGTADRIGLGDSVLHNLKDSGERLTVKGNWLSHREALQAIFEAVINEANLGETDTCRRVDAIGHRVVHGGQELVDPVLIDEETLEAIRRNTRLAPLHNRANLAGIEVCNQMLPNVPNVAVFDTAAHQTMPTKAFLYGLPIELHEKHGIRKYGFHGISHGYVAKETARILNKPFESLKIITCHLGNGCSVAAFAGGRSIDTSMGMTPLEGLMMATRSGDFDPSIVLYLIEELGLDTNAVRNLLNAKSGLLGLCGNGDMREVITAAKNGSRAAKTALDVFVYRVQKYVGAYIAAMNGVDAIVFTAGIGENSAWLRDRILANFGYLGVKIDNEKNERNEAVFSATRAKVRAMVVNTDEELAIAHETHRIITQTAAMP